MSEAQDMRLPVAVNERDHTIGPASANVTVLKYGDYQSPDCLRMHRSILKIIANLQDRVRFVYRHFPLVKVHPQALRAAEAAEAAAAQGKFWEMHNVLYLNPNKLEDRDLHRHANQIGLDLHRFSDEMAKNAYADQILKDYYSSITHGITGTPTIFVNDVLWPVTGVELVESVKALLTKP
jgi:formate-nitrite transporter family protein